MKVAEELWGHEAATAYVAALDAAHDFAKKSGCPLGMSVFRWLAEKNDDLSEAATTKAKAPLA